MNFEKSRKVIASGVAISLGSLGLSQFAPSAEASSSSEATTTTIKVNSIQGLTIGGKLNKVKIVKPVKGKNLESVSLSSDPATDQNGEDLAVVYSPLISNAIKRSGGIENKQESIGFLFTDGGKKVGVVESLVYFDTSSLIVEAISSGYGISHKWQQLYPLSVGPQPTSLGFDIVDRSLLIDNHRAVEILIKRVNTPTQSD
jgi:hypothetical protein